MLTLTTPFPFIQTENIQCVCCSSVYRSEGRSRREIQTEIKWLHHQVMHVLLSKGCPPGLYYRKLQEEQPVLSYQFSCYAATSTHSHFGSMENSFDIKGFNITVSPFRPLVLSLSALSLSFFSSVPHIFRAHLLPHSEKASVGLSSYVYLCK